MNANIKVAERKCYINGQFVASAKQIAKINPAIIRTLTSDTRAFQDFKARVHSLPAPPVASR